MQGFWKQGFGLGLGLLALSGSAAAIVVSDSVFVANGGNVNDVPGTIAAAFEPLRQHSLSPQFLSVVDIPSCTGNWIGDSADGKWAYILTAAHCLPYNTATTGPYSGTITDWAGRTVAKGSGDFYVHPYRLNKPAGFGGASTDIGLIRLPKVAAILNAQGQPLATPWLYDGSNENGRPVELVGYGSWGIGSTSSNGGWWPVSGQRRAWGVSKITGIWEMDYGIGAGFNKVTGADMWARTAPGDSGSSWWQQQDGFWTVIATTNGGNDASSTGARVSKYAGWVRSIYPGAQLYSERVTLTEKAALALPDLSGEAQKGTVAYLVPSQAAARGPAALAWKGSTSPATVSASLVNQSTKQSYQVKLRGWRNSGCGRAYYYAMNDAAACYGGRSSALVLQYVAADNPGLPAGVYQGSFQVEARGWHDAGYRKTLTVYASINVGGVIAPTTKLVR
ncbi:trypsin-like serine protease [Neisseriaceae bacterium JH1-16]|nr:trypsin-like serine protease [Neisseriaceae bacterium JH1-16]